MALATSVQTGLNLLQVSALRLPALFTAASATLLVGEIAYRTIRAALSVIGFDGSSTAATWLRDNTPTMIGKIVRPFRSEREYPMQTLVIYALVAVVMGAIANDAIHLLFGKAPAIYNHVLTFMGPIRISTDFHPATQYAMNYFGYTV
jgi:hypothetical protein